MEMDFIPITLFVVVTLALAIGLLVVANAIGPSRSSPVKDMPYESGMDPIHDTRRRFDVRFHLVAITFLLFDVEILFLYPWAVAHRPTAAAATVVQADSRIHSGGAPLLSGMRNPVRGIDAAVAEGAVQSRGLVFIGALVFIALITLGFIYDWRKGVFRWR